MSHDATQPEFTQPTGAPQPPRPASPPQPSWSAQSQQEASWQRPAEHSPAAQHAPAPQANSGEYVSTMDHVSKVYGEEGRQVFALHDVSVGIRRGEFTAIMGPSGSGKSTLMNIAAGLDRASGGRTTLGQFDISGMSDDELTVLRRRHVGFIFQAFNLVPTLDVQQNVVLPFELDGREPGPDDARFIDELIQRLALADRRSHTPAQLSGGQQQRVAICRALASRPEIVFADEPTGNLDSKSGRDVLGLLREATNAYGQTVVMVTHDPVAAAHADRVLMLADGRIVGDHGRMTSEEVSQAMLQLEARGGSFGGAR